MPQADSDENTYMHSYMAQLNFDENTHKWRKWISMKILSRGKWISMKMHNTRHKLISIKKIYMAEAEFEENKYIHTWRKGISMKTYT